MKRIVFDKDLYYRYCIPYDPNIKFKNDSGGIQAADFKQLWKDVIGGEIIEFKNDENMSDYDSDTTWRMTSKNARNLNTQVSRWFISRSERILFIDLKIYLSRGNLI